MKAIHPNLLQKLESKLQTKWNDAQPKVSVQVSRAKTTVSDSTYWVVETIRTKAGIGDLSIAARRMRPFGNPDRLFNIYVDNGIVKVAIREYPDYEEKKWQDQFNLGNGSAVAIAFDGYWDLYRNRWQMVTSEYPWLFWVDSGTLYAQYWDDESTKTTIATNVVKVKAIRGWRNINMPLVDQGVICGYIKTDGKVYYRNYAQQIDGFSWESEKQITEFTGTSINLNMFITNDYRMGFIVEDDAHDIKTVITSRAWAGLAIIPDTIRVAPVLLDVDLIPIDYFNAYAIDTLSVAPTELLTTLLYADTDNEVTAINIPKTMLDEFEEEYEDWGWIIEVEFDHPIPDLILSQVVATNVDNSTTIELESLNKISDTVYRLNISDVIESGINNVSGDIKITVTGSINPAGYTYTTMENTFTPLNLVPDEAGIPEVEEIYNE